MAPAHRIGSWPVAPKNARSLLRSSTSVSPSFPVPPSCLLFCTSCLVCSSPRPNSRLRLPILQNPSSPPPRMDFLFRAADCGGSPSWVPPAAWLLSCDGYFAEEEAMRAGLLEPPFGCEAMRREQRIRQEVRHRVIEEEVRREVEIATQNRIHGCFAPDAFFTPPPMPMHMFPRGPPPPPFDELGAHGPFRRFGPRGRAGFGSRFDRRQQMLSLPPPPPPPKLKLELLGIEPSQSSKAPSLAPKVAGKKRKAHAISVTDAPKMLQKPTQDWRCVLCQVSATSEAALNEHFEGKKHKAKLVQHGVISMNDNDKNKTTIINGNRSAPDDRAKKINIQVDGAMHAVIQKNNYLWCGRCVVRCESNVTMAGHLRGKKHRELNKDLAVGVNAKK